MYSVPVSCRISFAPELVRGMQHRTTHTFAFDGPTVMELILRDRLCAIRLCDAQNSYTRRRLRTILQWKPGRKRLLPFGLPLEGSNCSPPHPIKWLFTVASWLSDIWCWFIVQLSFLTSQIDLNIIQISIGSSLFSSPKSWRLDLIGSIKSYLRCECCDWQLQIAPAEKYSSRHFSVAIYHTTADLQRSIKVTRWCADTQNSCSSALRRSGICRI